MVPRKPSISHGIRPTAISTVTRRARSANVTGQFAEPVKPQYLRRRPLFRAPNRWLRWASHRSHIRFDLSVLRRLGLERSRLRQRASSAPGTTHPRDPPIAHVSGVGWSNAGSHTESEDSASIPTPLAMAKRTRVFRPSCRSGGGHIECEALIEKLIEARLSAEQNVPRRILPPSTLQRRSISR